MKGNGDLEITYSYFCWKTEQCYLRLLRMFTDQVWGKDKLLFKLEASVTTDYVLVCNY